MMRFWKPSRRIQNSLSPAGHAAALFLSAFLLLIPFGHALRAQDEAVADYRKIAGRWVDAFNRGDVKAILALYAPEAELVPPSGEYVEKTGIEQYWRQRLAAVPGKLSLQETETRASGDLAYETGVFRLDLSDGLNTKGRILSVLCRKSDGWKICAQMWSISPDSE